MNQQDILQKLDLSPSEAKTYLAVLNAGELKVADVAKLIGATRMAGYLAVGALKEKGLLGEFEKNGKKYVAAEDPDRLVLRLEEEKSRLYEQEKNLLELVPELKTLYQSAEAKPSVKVFQGVEGLKTVYEDTLKTMKRGENYIAFGSVEEAFSLLNDYLNEYVERRIKKNISFRGIAPADNLTHEFTSDDTAKLRQVRLVPKEKFPFKNEIDIYSNKVAILSFKDQIGLIIESKQIADTQRAIFELAWLGAERASDV